jgi:tetratricopeptide (TPR) repeat protein
MPSDRLPRSRGVSAGTDNLAKGSAPRKGLFCKESEYWTVGLGAKTFSLKDSRGLAFLAYLLRHPGTEFHSLDLVGGLSGGEEKQGDRLQPGQENLETAGIHIGSLGDAGELLDDRAKRSYRQRLSELREELEEARALGRVETAGDLEEEIDALSGELSRAVGMGGRNRRAASASERARQTVAKAIKAARERIAQSDRPLGEFFSRCIKTGTFCSYQPDPEWPIAWEFAGASAGPAETSRSSDKQAAADSTNTGMGMPAVAAFSTAKRTGFVGREHDFAALRAAVDTAQRGKGSLVMIAGGPGVGKTRLAVQIAEYAAHHGFACFLGHCYERDEPVPYLPFVEIIEAMIARTPSLDDFRRQLGDSARELAQLVPGLRRIFPDLPESTDMPDPLKRRYIFQSVTEALERASRLSPHLLILDDLHWADESTLVLLTRLGHRIARLPVVILGTYRDGGSDDNPALTQTLEELIRQGIRPLKLTGLSKDSVAQMLNQLSQRQIPEQVVDAIFEESNGNPFFVEEVYQHLLEEGRIFDSRGQVRIDLKVDEIDVPETVRLLIARRLKRFSDFEMRALSTAAVIGQSFSFQLLTAVIQMDMDELFTVIEKAQRMGIIVPSSEGPEKPLAFVHELVRQTLLASMSSARLQLAHAKVAGAIEHLYPLVLDHYVGEIADHLVKAGTFAERGALVHWLTRAGNAALEAAAFTTARANLESALSRVDEKDLRQRALLLDSIGFAERGLGRWDDAHRYWEEALNLFIDLDDQEGIGRTCVRFAQGTYQISGWRAAKRIAERGLARLSGVRSDRALLFTMLGLARRVVGDFRGAEESFNTALALAEELSDEALTGAILAYRTQFQWSFLRLHAAVEDSLRSGELIAQSALWIRVERLLWYQASLYLLGRAPEADKVGEELEPLANRVGHIFAVSFSRRMEAFTKFGRDQDLAQLENQLRTDLEEQKAVGLDQFVFLSLEQLSLAKFYQGKWDEALRHCEEALGQGPSRQAFTIGIALHLKAYAGDRQSALTLFNNNTGMLPRAGEANTYPAWALALLAIEGLFVLGERDQAAALYPLARELIATGTVSMTFMLRFPQTGAGIAAAAGHNWDLSESHFRVALEQAQSVPNILEQAEIRRFHAMMLLDRDARADRGTARELLREALGSYTRVGMRRHVELTQALIGRAGS